MKTTYDSECAVVLGMLAVLLATVVMAGCVGVSKNHVPAPVYCDVTDVDGMCWESPREYAQGWEDE